MESSNKRCDDLLAQVKRLRAAAMAARHYHETELDREADIYKCMAALTEMEHAYNALQPGDLDS